MFIYYIYFSHLRLSVVSWKLSTVGALYLGNLITCTKLNLVFGINLLHFRTTWMMFMPRKSTWFTPLSKSPAFVRGQPKLFPTTQPNTPTKTLKVKVKLASPWVVSVPAWICLVLEQVKTGSLAQSEAVVTWSCHHGSMWSLLLLLHMLWFKECWEFQR